MVCSWYLIIYKNIINNKPNKRKLILFSNFYWKRKLLSTKPTPLNVDCEKAKPFIKVYCFYFMFGTDNLCMLYLGIISSKPEELCKWIFCKFGKLDYHNKHTRGQFIIQYVCNLNLVVCKDKAGLVLHFSWSLLMLFHI